MTRRRTALALAAASCIACIAAGFGPATTDVPFRAAAPSARSTSVASSAGRFAVAFAAFEATKPRELTLRVKAKPAQWITAVWAVTCHRGFALKTKHGSASGRSPLIHTLPLALARPDRCSLLAGGQLEGSGSISVATSAAVAK